MRQSLRTAAGLGAVTGLRSMQGLAWTSHELADRRMGRGATELQQWLAADTVSIVLAGLALGELVADKLPVVPARVTPAPLVGRAVMGGVVGAAVGGRDDAWLCAAIGAGAAVLASYAGWLFRSEAARATRLPDPVLAIAEDTVAVLGARSLVERL